MKRHEVHDDPGEQLSAVTTQQPRERRLRAVASWSALTAIAVVLAILVSGWFLVAVPLTAVLTYGAWLGLSNEELSAAFRSASSDDPAQGQAGWTP